MLALLRTFSWQEARQNPWRSAAAVLAVTLGVALSFSVHLINASALDEFSGAARALGGQPDLTLRAVQGRMDEALFGRIAADPRVRLASPVLELPVHTTDAQGRILTWKVVAVDALIVAEITPALLPRAATQSGPLVLLAPATVFLNAAEQQRLAPGSTLRLQDGTRTHDVTIAGTVAAEGSPLAVMDLGAAQDLFGQSGWLSRIDLRLRPGTDRARFIASLALPPGVSAETPGDAAARLGALSRAYRVNLAALALVALFTGTFLVYSVLSLSVARRAGQFALLGVLGLTPRDRLRLVQAESLVLGLAGSALGVVLGTALAALGLHLLGGDLGGGYFTGPAPALHWDVRAAALHGVLGTVAAVAGGWWPARAARHLPPALTLKGLGAGTRDATTRSFNALPWMLMGASLLLAWLPPLDGVPVAAYGAVALLLVGGITALPALIALAYDRLSSRVARHMLALLAVERARHFRESAAVAISGVVASLSLSVALTVMVASFRTSVTAWLDVVLPADLYVRVTPVPGLPARPLPPELVERIAGLEGVRRIGTQRTVPLQLTPRLPAVTLISRELDDPGRDLMLVAGPVPVPAGHTAIWVSEAVVDLYGAQAGQTFPLMSAVFPFAPTSNPGQAPFFVAGVWRDYARQGGAIVIDRRDDVHLSGDDQVTDLALWLERGIGPELTLSTLRRVVSPGLAGVKPLGTGEATSPQTALDIISADDLRARSLRIFDRSFAVTYWLQAVAIGIGLFGVATSFSAQVLSRLKEFGLLAHLGFTRRQIGAVIAGEGAAWTVAGALAGLGLGLGVALVLVKVVNPQSFHWTMDLAVPWLRLAWLCLAVVLAGTLTAWLAGRFATRHDAVLAVKEDW